MRRSTGRVYVVQGKSGLTSGIRDMRSVRALALPVVAAMVSAGAVVAVPAPAGAANVTATPRSTRCRSIVGQPLRGGAGRHGGPRYNGTTVGHSAEPSGVGYYFWGDNRRFDGVPPAGDDTFRRSDVGAFGAADPEGIEFFPGRNTLLVLEHKTKTIYEVTPAGRSGQPHQRPATPTRPRTTASSTRCGFRPWSRRPATTKTRRRR
jgi:hypothetical protein